MKKQVLCKHLYLNKETVVHLGALDHQVMGMVKGGCTTVTIETCGDGCSNTLLYGPNKDSDNTCFTEEPHNR